ncbi:MAG TPA: hypothetical protein PLY87_14135 [Planctomycetaceae bacterium]|nr:hypothetical protein [Planctomycetaceae bacterium]HQZ66222.1 hypothetical protein [Planctomycetaceae bacterium]
MIHSLLGASWQTKLPAIIASIALIVGQAMLVIDGDPETMPDGALITTQVMLIIAMFQARANVVTSEQVKQSKKPRR